MKKSEGKGKQLKQCFAHLFFSQSLAKSELYIEAGINVVIDITKSAAEGKLTKGPGLLYKSFLCFRGIL